jgi:RNase P protein component
MVEMNESGNAQKNCDFVFVGKRECARAGMHDVYEELKKVMKNYKETGK